MNRAIAFLALTLSVVGLPSSSLGQEKSSRPIRAVRKFSSQEAEPTYNTHRFLFSPEVVGDGQDGTVRLAHSVLVADETGATDFLQTEPLSERLHAKKVFALDSADVRNAELFLFGSADQIHVNGKPVGKAERLVSTGWMRLKIPPALLKAGENEVVFSSGGSLLLEPSRGGPSFKNTEPRRAWSGQDPSG